MPLGALSGTMRAEQVLSWLPRFPGASSIGTPDTTVPRRPARSRARSSISIGYGVLARECVQELDGAPSPGIEGRTYYLVTTDLRIHPLAPPVRLTKVWSQPAQHSLAYKQCTSMIIRCGTRIRRALRTPLPPDRKRLKHNVLLIAMSMAPSVLWSVSLANTTNKEITT